MKYTELKIKVKKEYLDDVLAELAAEGFDGVMIDDPDDVKDILDHPDTYRYDYINDELKEGLDRRPVITLYFEDSEKGCIELEWAKQTAMKAVRNCEKFEDGVKKPFKDDHECAADLDKPVQAANVRTSDLDMPEKDANGSAADREIIETVYQSRVSADAASDNSIAEDEKNLDEESNGAASPVSFAVSEAGDDSTWLYKWQEFFKPTKVGERVVVKPSWEDYTAAAGELVIEMDPGMAFGSGLHETTSMCIKALGKAIDGKYEDGCGSTKQMPVSAAAESAEDAAAGQTAAQANEEMLSNAAAESAKHATAEEAPGHAAANDTAAATEEVKHATAEEVPGHAVANDTAAVETEAAEHTSAESANDTAAPEKGTGKSRFENCNVLDVGTGTGILAIAAALLGAGECLGIDIDEDAVNIARANIDHNGLADRITAQYGDLTEGVDYKADIVVANLMADLVIRLTPDIRNHLSEGGIYITSGILDIKEEVCRQAIEDAGFTVIEILRDGEWRAIAARA